MVGFRTGKRLRVAAEALRAHAGCDPDLREPDCCGSAGMVVCLGEPYRSILLSMALTIVAIWLVNRGSVQRASVRSGETA
jgi:hypothetical protein